MVGKAPSPRPAPAAPADTANGRQSIPGDTTNRFELSPFGLNDALYISSSEPAPCWGLGSVGSFRNGGQVTAPGFLVIYGACRRKKGAESLRAGRDSHLGGEVHREGGWKVGPEGEGDRSTGESRPAGLRRGETPPRSAGNAVTTGGGRVRRPLPPARALYPPTNPLHPPAPRRSWGNGRQGRLPGGRGARAPIPVPRHPPIPPEPRPVARTRGLGRPRRPGFPPRGECPRSSRAPAAPRAALAGDGRGRCAVWRGAKVRYRDAGVSCLRRTWGAGRSGQGRAAPGPRAWGPPGLP